MKKLFKRQEKTKKIKEAIKEAMVRININSIDNSVIVAVLDDFETVAQEHESRINGMCTRGNKDILINAKNLTKKSAVYVFLHELGHYIEIKNGTFDKRYRWGVEENISYLNEEIKAETYALDMLRKYFPELKRQIRMAKWTIYDLKKEKYKKEIQIRYEVKSKGV